MTTNRHKYFRFNPRTARLTIVYAMVVPAIFGVMAYQTDVSSLTRSNWFIWGAGKEGLPNIS